MGIKTAAIAGFIVYVDLIFFHAFFSAFLLHILLLIGIVSHLGIFQFYQVRLRAHCTQVGVN